MSKNKAFQHPAPPRERGRALKDALTAAGIVGMAVLLEELLRLAGVEAVPLALLFMLSTFAVACLTTGYLAGILAAVANTFLYGCLVAPPRLGFSFTAGLAATLTIMLAASLLISAATTRMKQRAAAALQHERRAELMLEVSRKMGAAGGIAGIIQVAAEYLSQQGMAGVFYRGDPARAACTRFPPQSGEEAAPPTPEAMEAARAFYLEPARCAAHNAGCPAVHYVPVAANGTVLGLIALHTGGKAPGKNQSALLQLIAGQAALAMALWHVNEERTKTLMLAEKEKTRGNLLRAISHDLRTPLTGILSASAILADKTGDPMAAAIREDAKWLIHMVENLLMVTRIAEGENKITKKPEIAEEVMARAVGIVRKRFPGCSIRVKAPDDPVMVPMDAMLATQVFVNLLENAVKYSPKESPVFFDMEADGHSARFMVRDSGAGIPENLLDDLFSQHPAGNEKNARSAGGMGIGLSICKTIVEAHGGGILGENREKGGALFTVHLPMNA